MNLIRFLSISEVIAINVAVIQRYSPGEQIGVKSQSLLESAVFRPQDAYPSLFEKAAALFVSLGQNHAFHNANKRTAFTALVIFLKYNGFSFKMEQKRAEDLAVDMVEHKFNLAEIAEIINSHSHQLNEKK
ncbi:type II toxin-antitoxin system death-on-curing family toxin [Paenibacillus sp. GP183]|jgi:death on curing protein|uniref:type II toxin-antitoxin system death-on-curing family toxin n=1 Tax=Paenibacillus sp. GP183 TaxID=1882751 RepID=UPI000898CE7E|nr:type II toxin-antitoxin system death-on-curing family toxin [Paenibacillus sp. GP183]SEC32082.1 death on curing protein [Paenibacillus sp. GP183]